jgi:hypothetical protein
LHVVQDTRQRAIGRINKQDCQQRAIDVEYRCDDGRRDIYLVFIDMSTDRGRSFVQLGLRLSNLYGGSREKIPVRDAKACDGSLMEHWTADRQGKMRRAILSM